MTYLSTFAICKVGDFCGLKHCALSKAVDSTFLAICTTKKNKTKILKKPDKQKPSPPKNIQSPLLISADASRFQSLSSDNGQKKGGTPTFPYQQCAPCCVTLLVNNPSPILMQASKLGARCIKPRRLTSLIKPIQNGPLTKDHLYDH